MNSAFDSLGFVAAVTMPFWNIPLIWRVVKRKTSDDISLAWLFGVWGSIVLMTPSALKSSEVQYRAFAISNIVLFSCVVATVLLFRKKK